MLLCGGNARKHVPNDILHRIHVFKDTWVMTAQARGIHLCSATFGLTRNYFH